MSGEPEQVGDGGSGAAGHSVFRNRTVLGTGLASFFSDSGHEMATAALPGFLRALGAPAAALGAIEGIADAALSTAKVAGGVLADRPGVERRKLAAVGYLTTGLSYGCFALAGSWPFVAIARAAAWIARGARTPARDSLLAASVPPSHLGRAFGVERAGDSFGAIVGPLGAAALIGVLGYRWLFAVSILPAVGAALAVLLLVHEAPRIRSGARAAAGGIRDLVRVPGPFRALVAGVGLYGLGNFSSTLLILRATDLLAGRGASPVHAATLAILLYTAHNAANALVAYPAGALADRLGRRVVLVAGIVMFAGACFVFAGDSANLTLLAVLFVVVGASKGMVETAEGSYASELLPEEIPGRGFGLLGLVDGAGDLVSSVTVGVLWTVVAPSWGFLYAAALSLAGALVLGLTGGAGLSARIAEGA